MADLTLTTGPAYAANVLPKTIHAGANIVAFSWGNTGGVTVSASAVVQLVKIPKGAIVTSALVFGYYGSDAGATIDLGFNLPAADVSAFASAKTISATATINVQLATGYSPYLVSISDDAGVDYRYFQAKFVTATSNTATAILKGHITYIMDDKIKS